MCAPLEFPDTRLARWLGDGPGPEHGPGIRMGSDQEDAAILRVERAPDGFLGYVAAPLAEAAFPDAESNKSTPAAGASGGATPRYRPSAERIIPSSPSLVLGTVRTMRGRSGSMPGASVHTRILPVMSPVTSVLPSAEISGVSTLASWPQSCVKSRVACRQR